MRILFCAYDRPGHFATGPNAWLQRLIPDLDNLYNFEIQVLFFVEKELDDCPTVNYIQKKNANVHIRSKENFIYTSDQVKEILKLVQAYKIELVVANLVVPAYYSAKYLRKFNIPTIGVIHSDDLFYEGVVRKFVGGKAQDALTSFVAVSDFLLNKATVQNSHNIMLSKISCGTPLSHKTASRTNAELKVLYAGRLEIKAKQILKLVSAFISASEENDNYTFSIYGSGSQKEEVDRLLNQSSRNEKVKYRGQVYPDEMFSLMEGYHVFTLMSDYEGMPVALMEAMSCGLVPICLKESSGINEIIDHGVNGFIVEDRGEDYREKLKIIYDNPELWNRMSENAKITIHEKYSSNITSKKWADLLLSCKTGSSRKLRLPLMIKIEGDFLEYGEVRKPPFIRRFKKRISEIWLALRLLIRPRKRLESFLNRKENERK